MALSLLGATGSIGRQTLDVAERLGYPVCALAAGKRAGELEAAARRFRPKLAVLYDEGAAADLRVRLADTETKVLSGMGGLLEAASLEEADTVLAAMSGAVGLRPALRKYAGPDPPGRVRRLAKRFISLLRSPRSRGRSPAPRWSGRPCR